MLNIQKERKLLRSNTLSISVYPIGNQTKQRLCVEAVLKVGLRSHEERQQRLGVEWQPLHTRHTPISRPDNPDEDQGQQTLTLRFATRRKRAPKRPHQTGCLAG